MTTVPGCVSSVAVHFYHVLVILENFQDHSAAVPFGGVVSGLILDKHPVPYAQWGEASGVLTPSAVAQGPAFVHGCLSLGCRRLIQGCLFELVREGREQVPDWPSEYTYGW